MIPDKNNSDIVGSHILIDCGSGVVDSLVSSKIKGLENIKGILLTHWHPDHVLGLNQLCESIRRVTKREGKNFVKIPFYCTLETYKHLQHAYSYEFDKMLCFYEVISGKSFKINNDCSITFTPLEVAHGSVKGSVIFIAEVNTRKIVFFWDIDTPDSKRPSDGLSNHEILEKENFENVKLMLLAANTWHKTGTGHTSFEKGLEYIHQVKPEKVLLLHLSGHEDNGTDSGFGWNDMNWKEKVKKIRVDKVDINVALQGNILKI